MYVWGSRLEVETRQKTVVTYLIKRRSEDYINIGLCNTYFPEATQNILPAMYIYTRNGYDCMNEKKLLKILSKIKGHLC